MTCRAVTAAWCPGRPARGEFRDNIDVALGLGDRLGCRAFNALYGNRSDDAPASEQDELAAENLALAAKAAARIGGTVLVEPVSGAPRYPLLTAADVAARHRPGRTSGRRDNLRLLLRPLPPRGERRRRRRRDRPRTPSGIGHVQIADAPGRHEPGTGELDIDQLPARRSRPPGTTAGSGWSTSPAEPARTASTGCRVAAGGSSLNSSWPARFAA